jgi:hypothetical protein
VDVLLQASTRCGDLAAIVVVEPVQTVEARNVPGSTHRVNIEILQYTGLKGCVRFLYLIINTYEIIMEEICSLKFIL